MNAVLPDFRERFGIVPHNYPIDNNVLEAKKDEAMKGMLEEKDKPTMKLETYRAGAVGRCEQALFTNYDLKVNNTFLSWVFKVSERQIRRDREAFSKHFVSDSITGGDVVGAEGLGLLEQKQSFPMPKKAKPKEEEKQ
jgi:hypothetical protein